MKHFVTFSLIYMPSKRFLTSFGFTNKCLSLGMIRRYQTTFKVRSSFSISWLSTLLFFCLNRDNPHFEQFLNPSNYFLYNMKSLGCAYIFLYSKPIEQIIFLVSQLRVGSVFTSWSISFNKTRNYMELILVHPLVAFKFINLNTVDNHVNLLEPTYNKVFASMDIIS